MFNEKVWKMNIKLHKQRCIVASKVLAANVSKENCEAAIKETKELLRQLEVFMLYRYEPEALPPFG